MARLQHEQHDGAGFAGSRRRSRVLVQGRTDRPDAATGKPTCLIARESVRAAAKPQSSLRRASGGAARPATGELPLEPGGYRVAAIGLFVGR